MLNFTSLASAAPVWRNTTAYAQPAHDQCYQNWGAQISHVKTQSDVVPVLPDVDRRLQYWTHHVIGGGVHILKFAIQAGVYAEAINVTNALGESALISAVLQQDDAVVDLLLQLPGIDVNAKDRYGTNALALARHGGSPSSQLIVQRLLQHPQIITQPDLPIPSLASAGEPGAIAQESSLIGAVKLRRYDIVSSLLQSADVAVNAFDEQGGTALSWAVRIGGLAGEAMVRMLLRQPEIDVTLDHPMAWAVQGQHETIIALLRNFEMVKEGRRHDGVMQKKAANGGKAGKAGKAGPSASTSSTLPDGAQVSGAATGEVKDHILSLPPWALGHNRNYTSKTQSDDIFFRKFLTRYSCSTPGRRAAILEYYRALDVKLKRNLWRLHAFDGRVREVSFLLACDLGRDIVNACDENGKTALIVAAQRGQLNVITALLATDGIDVNHCDKQRGSALSYAASRGFNALVFLLLERQDLKPNEGVPLIAAVKKNRPIVVDRLVHVESLDVNAMVDGVTALGLAAADGNLEIVRRLLTRHDLDVNLGNPLCLAVSSGRESTVRLLLEDQRLDVGAHEISGKSALQLAMQFGYLNIQRSLRRALGNIKRNEKLKLARENGNRTEGAK